MQERRPPTNHRQRYELLLDLRRLGFETEKLTERILGAARSSRQGPEVAQLVEELLASAAAVRLRGRHALGERELQAEVRRETALLVTLARIWRTLEAGEPLERARIERPAG